MFHKVIRIFGPSKETNQIKLHNGVDCRRRNEAQKKRRFLVMARFGSILPKCKSIIATEKFGPQCVSITFGVSLERAIKEVLQYQCKLRLVFQGMTTFNVSSCLLWTAKLRPECDRFLSARRQWLSDHD